jgi:hypothetical protein
MTLFEEPPLSVVSGADFNLYDNLVLDDDNLTLDQTYAKFLSSNELDENVTIPLIVRMFENPKSPIRLTGAVSLYHHDIIHCILGRGIAGYDEAFVIGMTMGSVKKLKKFEVSLYKFIGRHLFPGIYNFSYEDLLYFDAGVALAKSMADIKPLDSFNPKDMLHKTMKQVRHELGIDMTKVMAIKFPDTAPNEKI